VLANTGRIMRAGVRLAVTAIAFLMLAGSAVALPPIGSGGNGDGDGGQPKTCVAPLVLVGANCVPCKTGTQYSAATKKCVATSTLCPNGTFGTYPNCHPVIIAKCPPNQVGTPGNCHFCPAGQHPQNGQCVS
jgi:hypothetical protein